MQCPPHSKRRLKVDLPQPQVERNCWSRYSDQIPVATVAMVVWDDPESMSPFLYKVENHKIFQEKGDNPLLNYLLNEGTNRQWCFFALTTVKRKNAVILIIGQTGIDNLQS